MSRACVAHVVLLLLALCCSTSSSVDALMAPPPKLSDRHATHTAATKSHLHSSANNDTVSIFSCLSTQCAPHTCSLWRTVPTSQCLLIPTSSLYQRLHCATLTKAMCIQETLYLPAGGGTNATPPTCSSSNVIGDTTMRCGVCQPRGSGDFGRIHCDKGSSHVSYEYNCSDNTCSNCTKKITAEVGQCGTFEHIREFRVHAVVACPSILYYQLYSDAQCTQKSGSVQQVVAGDSCQGLDPSVGGIEYRCNAN